MFMRIAAMRARRHQLNRIWRAVDIDIAAHECPAVSRAIARPLRAARQPQNADSESVAVVSLAAQLSGVRHLPRSSAGRPDTPRPRRAQAPISARITAPARVVWWLPRCSPAPRALVDTGLFAQPARSSASSSRRRMAVLAQLSILHQAELRARRARKIGQQRTRLRRRARQARRCDDSDAARQTSSPRCRRRRFCFVVR